MSLVYFTNDDGKRVAVNPLHVVRVIPYVRDTVQTQITLTNCTQPVREAFDDVCARIAAAPDVNGFPDTGIPQTGKLVDVTGDPHSLAGALRVQGS